MKVVRKCFSARFLQSRGSWTFIQYHNKLQTQRFLGTSPQQDDPDLATAKPFSEVPGNKGIWKSIQATLSFLPLIGKNAGPSFSLDDMHMQCYKSFGKLARFDVIGRRKFVFVYDPDDIRKVFQHEGLYPHRIMLHLVKEYRESLPERYASSGILIENGKKWHSIRSNVQGAILKPSIVDTYIPAMEAVAKDFVKHMKTHRDNKNQEIPNFLNELYKWALESVGLVAFNARLGCLKGELEVDSDAQLLINASNTSFASISNTEFGVHWWKYFPSSAYRKLAQSQEIAYNIAAKYLEITLKEINEQPEKTDIGGILGVYIRDGTLDRKEILTFLLDLLQAGIDTTSHSMAFTLYLLARNPDKQEKAYKEIMSLQNSNLSRDDLDNLPYLDACIKESMRMLAVASGTLRILNHDIALSGYRIPAGVGLVLLTQIVSCLPEHFEKPDKFLPERWLLKAKKPHPFSNLPFGHGLRSCVGKRLAVQQIQLLLIQVLKNFKVEYHYEDMKRVTRFINMPDKPLRFSFLDRDAQ